MMNLIPEGLVMKTTTGMTTEDKETLVAQYHVVKGIEITHHHHHVDVVEEVVEAVEAETVVETAEGTMEVMASQMAIEDHHDPPTATVERHEDILCLQQTRLDTVPLGYMKQPNTIEVACTSVCTCSCVNT
jgi:DUF1009 family protein